MNEDFTKFEVKTPDYSGYIYKPILTNQSNSNNTNNNAINPLSNNLISRHLSNKKIINNSIVKEDEMVSSLSGMNTLGENLIGLSNYKEDYNNIAKITIAKHDEDNKAFDGISISNHNEMSTNTNDFLYFKNLIEKMNGEITNLSSKLENIEKNNTIYHNSNGKENKNNQPDYPNQPNGNINRTTTNSSLYNTKEHIALNSSNIKILSKLNKHEPNTNNNNISNLSNTNSNVSKSKAKKVLRSQSNEKPKKKNSKPKSQLPNNPKRKSEVAPTSKSPISKQKKGIKEPNPDLLQENEFLKSKIRELEDVVKKLNDQIAFDNIEKKGKDHLRVELEIWKNRSESITNTYLDNIGELKKQLNNDKCGYLDQIKNMQQYCSKQINEIKGKYQSTLEKYEINIKKMKKENEELRKRVQKVKDILIVNNNTHSEK